MTQIIASVGANGVNHDADVAKVRDLLNRNRHLLFPHADLDASDDLDKLSARIKLFQSRVVVNVTPDGRVDPAGSTLARLDENAKGLPQRIPVFPLFRRPTHDFETGSRQFGARRSGGSRKHAAVDLKAPPGTRIRAMDDGVVIVAPHNFYSGTKAFAVDHGGYIARYGEIQRTAPGIGRVGARVQKGQLIAYVGRLNSGNSMLHLELYTGARSGPLTNRSNPPFQRRSDLLNPMDFVRTATMTAGQHDSDDNARVGAGVASFLNVRSSANAFASIVAKLSPGTGLNVTGEVTGGDYDVDDRTRNDWFAVDVDGTTGFAAAYFVDRLGAGSTGPEGTVHPVLSLAEVSTRLRTVLNLRDAAVFSSNVIRGLPPREPLTVKRKLAGDSYTAGGESRTDWLEVEAGSDKGFVAAYYVDPRFQSGRVNDQVATKLRVRVAPSLDSAPVGALQPGSTFTITATSTGDDYDANGATRNDWYEVDADTIQGFVAAFFVDVVDDAAASSANAILFSYAPSGASDRTARQDGLPQRGITGVAASENMAETDRARVMVHKDKFRTAANLYRLPPALLAAIASRETRGGAVLDPDGWGDGRNAFGIMQVDKRFHSPIEDDDGPAGIAHIDQAIDILRGKLDRVEQSFEGLSDSLSLQTAVSRYNGGAGRVAPRSDEGTTGGDYMNDVWARARYYATVEQW